jgi:hypothetical protein
LTPPHALGTAVVQVTNNEVDFSNNSTFWYQGSPSYQFPPLCFLFHTNLQNIFVHPDEPTIQWIYPTSDTIGGGTEIKLFGSFFGTSWQTDLIKCRFGDNVVNATFVNVSHIVCFTPPHAPGIVPVSVSTNNQNFFNPNAIIFEFVPFTVTHVFPTFGHSNAVRTPILVYGFGFPHNNDLFCRIGASPFSKALWITPFTIECNAYPRQQYWIFGEGVDGTTKFLSVDVEIVLLNQLDILNEANTAADASYFYSAKAIDQYTYFPDLEITNISAVLGPLTGGTLVQIGEANGALQSEPFDSHLVYCRFGDQFVEAMFYNASSLYCVAPAANSSVDISVNVTVVSMGVEYTNNLTFTYRNIIVEYPFPETGPSSGNITITLQCNYCDGNLDQQYCVFDDHMYMPATRINSTHITCQTPQRDSGTTLIQVWIDSAPIGGKMSFFVYDDPMVTSLSRRSGPITGSTPLIVLGSGFLFSSFIRCRIGGYINQGTTLNSSAVICVTNPSNTLPAAEGYLIQISNNDQDFTTEHVYFEYQEVIVLSHAFPTLYTGSNSSLAQHGPVFGTIDVDIQGDHFYNSSQSTLSCKFGTSIVSAKWLSSTLVRCVLPPSNQVQIVSLSVTNNGWEYSDPIPFTYINSTITPTYVIDTGMQPLNRPYPDSGPITGNTLVYINTENLIEAVTYCEFNGERVLATWYNESLISCVAPPIFNLSSNFIPREPMEVQLRIQNLNVWLPSVISFVYHPIPKIQQIDPRSGSEFGETVVSIHGNLFSGFNSLHCRFGPSDSGEYKHVVGYFVDSGHIICTTPNLTITDTYDNVTVCITYNMQNYFCDSGIFTFFKLPSFNSVVPIRGPSVVGNTFIKVFGSDFNNWVDRLFCVFGTDMTPALLIDSVNGTGTEVTCRSPKEIAGYVAFGLSFNGQDYVHNIDDFHFYDVMILSIEPVNGVHTENTSVVISGFGFVTTDQYYCQFGSGARVPATALSTFNITCNTTTHTLQTDPYFSEEVAVTVWIDDTDVQGRVPFMYEPVPIVDDITPRLGPFGNVRTVVTLSGNNFVNRATAGCFFDDTFVHQTFVNTTRVECIAPVKFDTDGPSGHLNSSIVYSVNGIDKNSNVQIFEYVFKSLVLAIAPTFGLDLGGTNVYVTGTNFSQRADDLGYNFCSFGLQMVPAIFYNTTTLLCTTSRQNQSVVNFTLYENGVVFSSSVDIKFEFVPMRVNLITPLLGPSKGGTLVSIQGSQFITGRYFCVFGDNIKWPYGQPATVIDDTNLECLTPSYSDPPGFVRFRLYHENTAIHDQYEFYFYQTPGLESLVPQSGPHLGGTTLYISGSGFVASSTAFCRFTSHGFGVHVPLRLINSKVVLCTTPGLQIGVNASVDVTFNGQDYTNNSLVYSTYGPVNITGVFPRYSSLSGPADTLHVYGSGFSSFSNSQNTLACMFNDVKAKATFLSDTEITCPSPILVFQPSFESIFQITVTNNGIDFSATSVKFELRDNMFVTGIQPSHGPLAGNTRISIFGGNFNSDADGVQCKFGDLPAAAATYISSSIISCVAPSYSSVGSVQVLVSSNNHTFTSDPVLFTYEGNPTLTALTPIEGFPSTLVTFYGTNFTDTQDLVAKFGEVQSRCVFIRSTTATCSAPFIFPSVVSVSISNNGIDWSNEIETFVFLPSIRILSTTPRQATTNGGTLITVIGENFPPGSTCWFGSAQALNSLWVSNHELLCVAPPQPVGLWPIQVSEILVRATLVTDNNGVFVSFLDRPEVAELMPNIGPVQGGTEVNIRGQGFVESTDLFCKFELIRVPATFINSTWIRCFSPTYSLPLNVTVEVTVNNQDYSLSGLLFEYLPSLEVLELSPPSGSLGGGTLVWVYGSGFSERSASLGLIYCKFGTFEVQAVFLNSTNILCTTPAHTDAAVNFSVSNNKQSYESAVIYTYLPIVLRSLSPAYGVKGGGSEIIVIGEQFTDVSLTTCVFGGGRETLANFISSTVIRCKSVAYTSGSTSIDFYVHLPAAGEFISNTLQFIYADDPVVTSVQPVMGSINGGTEVLIEGQYLEFMQFCVFHLTAMPATFLGNEQALCNTPPLEEMGIERTIVQVSGIFDQGDVPPSSTVYFFFHDEIKVKNIVPDSGLPGTLVTVEAINLFKFLPFVTDQGTAQIVQYTCRFGPNEQPAEYLSETRLTCFAPSIGSGTVDVEIGAKGPDDNKASYTTDHYRFTFVSTATITSISPISGVPGTLVNVSGFNFDQKTRIRFGGVEVEILAFTTTSFTCIVPVQDIGVVTLQVSKSSWDWTGGSVKFTYLPPVKVLGFTPKIALLTGGTMVTVMGQNIAPGATCKFGSITSIASQWISNEELVCFAPAQIYTGLFPIRISDSMNTAFNGFSESYQQIEYANEPILYAIYPPYGPVSGNTVVSLRGDYFRESSDLRCLFGNFDAPALFVNTTWINCRSPAFNFVGNVTVQVTINKQDFTSSYFFEYQPLMVVIEAIPSQASSAGGDYIWVYGGPFSQLAASVEALKCKYGDTIAHSVFINSTTILCRSPPHSSGEYKLSVTSNSQQFSNEIDFTFIDLSIISVDPSFGFESGGTRVEAVVTGAILSRTTPGLIVCVFGAIQVPITHILNDRIECNAPGGTGNVTFRLAVLGDGLDSDTSQYQSGFPVYSNALEYHYSKLFEVSSATPQFISYAGNVSIDITGANFLNISTLVCVANANYKVMALYLSPTLVSCHFPPFVTFHSLTTQIAVKVGVNAQDFGPAFTVVEYTEEPILLTAEPWFSELSGGFKLYVTGMNLRRDQVCRFGVTSTAFEFISETYGSCMIPRAIDLGIVPLMVGLSDGGVKSNSLAFEYTHINLGAITPAVASESGGSRVILSGSGFYDTRSLFCKFGDTRVAASFVHSSEIICIVPPHEPGLVTLQVTANGHEWSLQNVTFSYLPNIRIWSIEPKVLLLEGGTVVTVRGENFLPYSGCRFGSRIATSVQWASPELLYCTSPRQDTPGNYQLEVEGNSANLDSKFDGFTRSFMSITYLNNPRVHQISPILGPLDGGTLINVRAENIIQTSELVCLFNGTLGNATYVNSTWIQCIAPTAHLPGNVTVQVSVNGRDFSSDQVMYEYQVVINTLVSWPSYSSAGGGMLLWISGNNFSPRSASLGTMYCKFDEVIVQPTFINTTMITCTTPIHAVGTVDLFVSNNGQTWIHVGPITYYGLTVSSITPQFGLEEGGTRIMVSNEDKSFPEFGALSCVFGGIRRVKALRHNSTCVFCDTPSGEIGVVDVLVEVDGDEFVSNPTQFEPGLPVKSNVLQFVYVPRPSVATIFPSKGSTLGGTEIVVSGSNFLEVSQMYCIFGDIVVEAATKSPTTLTCVAPSASLIGSTSVDIRVGVHQDDRSYSFAMFEYTEIPLIFRIDPNAGPAGGGTSIQVAGEFFTPGLTCRFDFGSFVLYTEFATLSSSFGLCITPILTDRATRTSSKLSLILASQSYGSNYVAFTYYPDSETNIQLRPLMLEAGDGQSTVLITGVAFNETENVWIRFGTNQINFAVSSELNANSSQSNILSVAPKSDPSIVTVSISLNAKDWFPISTPISFLPAIRVTGFTPRHVILTGGTIVTVIGENILPESTCKFGNRLALQSLWISHRELQCMAPFQDREGLYSLEVSGATQEFTNSQLQVSFVSLPVVHQIFPVTGPIHFSAMVSVIGENFINTPDLFCKFSNFRTQATWINSTWINCLASDTSDIQVGNVTIEVTANNQDFSTNGVLYEYQDRITLKELIPKQGSVGGGAVVWIKGRNFRQRSASLGYLFCGFDNTNVHAVFYNDTVIMCLSPAHLAGPVEVSVTNDVNFFSPPLQFVYNEITLLSIVPAHALALGGTKLVITGRNFGGHAGELFCFFDSMSNGSFAQVQNDTMIECSAPVVFKPTPYVSKVYVGIPTISFESNRLNLTFIEEVKVESTEPTTFPVGGGEMIRVFGSGFIPDVDLEGQMICRFGTTIVQGKFISSSEILCPSPVYPSGNVTLEVSMNAKDYSTNGVQVTVRQMRVYSIDPVSGPAVGGTHTTIRGENFPQSTTAISNVFCKFGTNLKSPANVLTPFLLECTAPPNVVNSSTTLLNGTDIVPVSVIFGNIDESEGSLVFLYHNQPTVAKIFPRWGLDSVKTPVFVTGIGFTNHSTLVCKFGNRIVYATYISSSRVLCNSPIWDLSVELTNTSVTDLMVVRVAVEVSNNMRDFSNNQVLFEYSKAKPGTFRAGNRISPCPTGSKCPGYPSLNFTFCSPGTFQDVRQQSECKPCPIGFMCPEAGLSAPVRCSRGYVCDRENIVKPTLLCPQGHYCLDATGTVNPLNYSTPNRPMPCPNHTYCDSGVLSPITVLGDKTTPQPCFPGYVCYSGSDSPYGSGPCPTNYYCPPNSFPIPCPKGAFCPNTGNTFPQLCPAQFYNSFTHQNRCLECPPGYICSQPGLQAPELCPAGFVCSTRRISTPSSLCPSGYSCPAGTETYDTSSTTMFGPQICDSGFYCLDGVKVGTEASKLNDFTTPQQCPAGYYCLKGTGSAGGTNKCWEGHYCPVQTSLPVPAGDGTYTSEPGFATATICLFGYYCQENATLIWDPTRNVSRTAGTTFPILCPDGHQCAADVQYVYDRPEYINNTSTDMRVCETNTDSNCIPRVCSSYKCETRTGCVCVISYNTYPIPCQPGRYRAGNDTSIQCSLCPEGSYYTTPRLITTIANRKYWDGAKDYYSDDADAKSSYKNTHFLKYVYFDRTDQKWTVMSQFNSLLPFEPNVQVGGCLPCLEGLVCAKTGLIFPDVERYSGDVNYCPEGYYCVSGRTASTQFDNTCPNRFHCGYGLGNETQVQMREMSAEFFKSDENFAGLLNLNDRCIHCWFGTSLNVSNYAQQRSLVAFVQSGGSESLGADYDASFPNAVKTANLYNAATGDNFVCCLCLEGQLCFERS